MPPDVLTKVFEPFFTTKDIGRGTGLGLSQVYGFIKQSGGHVKIYSEPNQGTTVKIYLPHLQSVAADHLSAEDTRLVPHGDAGECIQVVEDEDGVRALTVEMLRDLGYGVLQAIDVRSALAVLEREPGMRLLFTDIGLPGGLTGRLDPGVELIGKPFSAVDLAHRVRALLDAVKA
jgi:hypothetical protein